MRYKCLEYSLGSFKTFFYKYFANFFKRKIRPQSKQLDTKLERQKGKESQLTGAESHELKLSQNSSQSEKACK